MILKINRCYRSLKELDQYFTILQINLCNWLVRIIIGLDNRNDESVRIACSSSKQSFHENDAVDVISKY